MSNEATIERGLAAASLLSDPTFQSVIQSLAVECFATFTESKPSDRDGREDTYNLYRGLQAIEAELNARVQAKDEAIISLDAALNDRDQHEVEGPIFIQGNTDQ
ncbi:hypothetical protein [Novosphingobium clariflavum]|uniref:Uncharacterized protein n=1 Tax=Novosphingobium clariflavum TaxID=2029884 RepID=A0ABV6SB31_9SPHN|nr:hypothetical protein [Novosphingobium clariflavum]